MSIFSASRSRGVAVLAAAAVLAVSAGSGAVAGAMITGKDIKNRTIEAQDLKRGAVTTTKVKNRTLKLKDLSSEVTAKLGVQGSAGAAGAAGAAGPQGPAGPMGGSNVTQVTNLDGEWKARAADVAGIRMTGDGIAFGPFADAGQCGSPGVDYARLDYSGMNGKTLNTLDNLVYYARYIADVNTSGIGAPYLRVFFEGTGTGGTLNRLTFSANTQFNNTNAYDLGEASSTSGSLPPAPSATTTMPAATLPVRRPGLPTWPLTAPRRSPTSPSPRAAAPGGTCPVCSAGPRSTVRRTPSAADLLHLATGSRPQGRGPVHVRRSRTPAGGPWRLTGVRFGRFNLV